MGKRALSMLLLAVVTLFSLCVSAFAQEEPVAAEGPEASETSAEPVTVDEPMTVAETSGDCGAGVTWRLSADGTVLTVSGTGRMTDYAIGNYAPWDTLKNRDKITSVVVKSGVTYIGDRAFQHLDNLVSVSLAKTITGIGEWAFYGDVNLAAVTLPDGVTSIGDCAFYDCPALKTMNVPASVTSVGYDAFGGGTYLDSLTIRNPDCRLAASMFYNSRKPVIHGLASSTAEEYAVRANCVFETFGPAFPTVKKVTNTCDGVKITWQAVSGAAKYKVYCKEAFGAWTLIASAATGTSYTWKKAENGAGYSFSVQAMDQKGNALTGYDKTGKSITYYAAPTVKITQSASGIKVTWNAISGAPRYMVYYKENGGAWQKIGTTTNTSYTRAASKLKNGTTYQFTVRCCASDKKTLLSDYKASSSLKYIVKLAAPTVKIAQTASGIKVTWNAVSGAPRYMVYYKENGGAWHKIGTTTKTSYTRAAAKLKNGTTYQFTVRCCAADKKTLLSDYKASNSLKYIVKLAAPTVKIAKTSGGIKVTWNKVSGASRYTVYYKENGGAWHKIGTTTSTSYTRAASKLKSGVTYQFTVRCCASDKKTLLSDYKASNSLKYKK